MPADPPDGQAQGRFSDKPEPASGSEAGTAGNSQAGFSSYRESRSRSLGPRGRGFSVIVAPLRVEGDNAWQAFLLGTCNNCRILAQWIHRVGLPHTSVADKMPYWRRALTSTEPHECA